MNKKIEFIEEYIKVGNDDYKWNDNHGELVRCKECIHFTKRFGWNAKEYTECARTEHSAKEDGFCAWGERKDDEEQV